LRTYWETYAAKRKTSVEQQYFQHDDLFQYLRALEDELIDPYLQGELSGATVAGSRGTFLPLRLGVSACDRRKL
jgi:hypothetical protein